RWKVNRDFSLDIESSMNRETVEGLRALGHTMKSVDDPYMDFGAGQFIWRMHESDNELGYVAASDSRRDGQAGGFLALPWRAGAAPGQGPGRPPVTPR